MYEAIADPYCYPRSSVLENIPGLTSQDALEAGHPLDLDGLDPEAFLQAVIGSFRGEEQSLARQIAGLVR